MHTHVNRNNWRWNLKVSAFSRYSFSFYYWLIRFWVLLFALGLHICNCHLSDAAVPGWSDISSSSFLGWWSSLPGGQNRHKQRAPSDVAVTIAGLLWSPWYGCDCNSILHLHCNFCIIYKRYEFPCAAAQLWTESIIKRIPCTHKHLLGWALVLSFLCQLAPLLRSAFAYLPEFGIIICY